jgi:hypothetical protein
MTAGSIRVGALVVLILGLAQQASCFSLRPNSAFVGRASPSTPTAFMCPDSDNKDDDPTKVWYAGLADAIQNVLTNSPLNEGKKALVKSLAGEYDQEAVRAKLDGLIADKPVLMLSFVK